MPAIFGLSKLTIWNLRGKLKSTSRREKPVQSVELHRLSATGSHGEGHSEMRTGYRTVEGGLSSPGSA